MHTLISAAALLILVGGLLTFIVLIVGISLDYFESGDYILGFCLLLMAIGAGMLLIGLIF